MWHTESSPLRRTRRNAGKRPRVISWSGGHCHHGTGAGKHVLRGRAQIQNPPRAVLEKRGRRRVGNVAPMPELFARGTRLQHREPRQLSFLRFNAVGR